MFLDVDEDFFKLSDSLDAFSELERCTDKAVLSLRSSERIEVRARLTLRPINPSQRHAYALEGVTADISNGGCLVLASRAILPGDFYCLAFDEALTKVGTQFARCIRCRMIQDDAYEIGIRFLQDISLKDLV